MEKEQTMIIKKKDKNGNLITFNPKGRASRYNVNGENKKGVTTLIGERFGKGALMWWSENCVYEALIQTLKMQNKPVDVIQSLTDDIKARVKVIKEQASTIGTNLHTIAEQYVKGQKVIMPETEPLKTMFNKFKAFWDRSGFKLVASEETMYSPDLDVCGTTDLVVTKPQWKGKYGILDIKTSKDFYVDMAVQIHTYKKLLEDSSNLKIDYLGVINVPKEPVKEVSLLMFKISDKYLKAFKACKYLHGIEDDFKKRMIEYNKQKGVRNAK